MWLTVIGFEFRKHFPCSQKLSDCFSSRSTVIFFLFLSIILKVIFFIFFFFFCQLHTVLGQSLPHLETQSLSLFTNPKSMVIAKTCFFFFFILFFYYYFLFVVNFVIHWNETAMGLHVFPIPIPPPTSRSKRLSHASNLGWWSVSP